MLSRHKIRGFVSYLGLLLLGLLIWYTGPYFIFGAFQPLESVTARAVVIILIVGGRIVVRRLAKGGKTSRALRESLTIHATQLLRRAWQLGAYPVMLLIAVAGFIAFSTSYTRNAAYLAAVAADVAEFRRMAAPAGTRSPDQQLTRLNAVRALADSAGRYSSGAPLSMRFGLFQGDSLGIAARDAYSRELASTLLPDLTSRIEQQIVASASQPLKLYEYLKAYLMLGDLSRMDKSHLAGFAHLEWKDAFPTNPDLAEALTRHFQALLDNQDLLWGIPLNPTIVSGARTALTQLSIPQFVYQKLRLNNFLANELRLDSAIGLGATEVFTRKSGASLSQPMAGIYTRETFREITGGMSAAVVRDLAAEYWVWGEQPVLLKASAGLDDEVTGIYVKDYIAVWDGILQDIEAVPIRSLNDTKRALLILAASPSPLRGLLEVIDRNTFLPDPEPSAPQTPIQRLFGRALGRTEQANEVPKNSPGVHVTAHFADIHSLVTGTRGAAVMDSLRVKLDAIRQRLSPLGDVSEARLLNVDSVREMRELTTSLKRDAASLPPTLADVVVRIADSSLAAVR